MTKTHNHDFMTESDGTCELCEQERLDAMTTKQQILKQLNELLEREQEREARDKRLFANADYYRKQQGVVNGIMLAIREVEGIKE